MMNYVWAGLVIFSLLFALGKDYQEISQDRYRNGQNVPIQLDFPNGYIKGAHDQEVSVVLPAARYQSFYGLPAAPKGELRFKGKLTYTSAGTQLNFGEGAALPEPMATIQKFTNKKGKDLQGALMGLKIQGDTTATAGLALPKVRFVKLNAITDAALSFADTAVEIALSLIGVMALWLGLMQIASKIGLIEGLVRFVGPIFRPLFPTLPKDHPAMGLIILNMAANMLGLGNAATPMGIKAMHELQTLNPSDDTATDDMVTFLALNTSSVQVVPPATLVAIMGLAVNQLFFTILIATFFSTLFGAFAAVYLKKLPRYAKTNPGTKAVAAE